MLNAEAVVQRCSVKKVFFEISQNLQENTCARVSFLTKWTATLLKKRLWHECFPVNFVKFLRTRFLHNISGRLLWSGKPLYLFACERTTLKRIFNTNSELSQNRTEKQIMPFKTTVNWLFNDI